MIDTLLDALIDSLKVFGFALILYIIFSFVEEKITILLEKHKKASPVLGSLCGLIPQCGTSVVASDLYLKNHISMGTLVAVFFSCSDEALPILLSDHTKALSVIPLLLIKLIVGFLLGYFVDLFIKRDLKEEPITLEHIGCCHHHIDNDDNKLKEHLIHPLIHSLKIFLYVLVVNSVFGLIIYYIGGEDVLASFLLQNKYLTPLFSTIIGIIPNCASSVLVSELYLLNGIPFAALVSGLCMNAGLGFVYLLKNKKNFKDVLIMFSILFISSLVTGYIIMGIMNLF